MHWHAVQQSTAELTGFHTNCDAAHITQPQQETMPICMRAGVAKLPVSRPADVGYVNAHGTATERGDIAESLATAAVFGETNAESPR